jgi:hypothetical protein
MGMTWRSTVAWSSASLLLALAVVPSTAIAADVTLYEVTENMKLTKQRRMNQHRVATSALLGFADLGSPLCPPELVISVKPEANRCAVNAVGNDDVSLKNGKGPLFGSFTVVINEPGSVDSPEFVVMRGHFDGKIDFSPAFSGAGFGTAQGRMTISGVRGRFPFTGIFRQPFIGTDPFLLPDGTPTGLTQRQFHCGVFSARSAPLIPGHGDVAWTDRFFGPGDPRNACIDAVADELAVGYPTVRFEITFAP